MSLSSFEHNTIKTAGPGKLQYFSTNTTVRCNSKFRMHRSQAQEAHGVFHSSAGRQADLRQSDVQQGTQVAAHVQKINASHTHRHVR